MLNRSASSAHREGRRTALAHQLSEPSRRRSYGAKVVSLVGCLCVASAAAFGQCPPPSPLRYVMQFQPPASAVTQFQGYFADGSCTTPAVNTNGPSGVTQIVAKPDGSKFFLLGTGAVQSVDSGFLSFQGITGITGTPTTMAISPDGRYLYVGASGLFIIDTASNTILTNNIGLNGTISGIAFSADSNFAYILTNAPLFGSYVSKVSTASRALFTTSTSNGQLLLPNGAGTSISMSPRQLLYVTSGTTITEIDPVALAPTSNSLITTIGQYTGPIRYTGDGSTAYAVGQNVTTTGYPLLQFNLTSHAISELNYSSNPGVSPIFTDVFPVSASRVFAVTTSDQTQTYYNSLYDITPSPLGAQLDTTFVQLPGGIVRVTLAGALSNEQPSPRYLYLLISGGYLDRIDLNANTLSLGQGVTIPSGTLQFVSFPPQSGPDHFLTFNATQTVPPGGSATLGGVVLNSAGLPVYNVQPTYTANSSGILISGVSTASNKDGYVQAKAIMPTTAGSYTITLTAGSASTTFTVVVSSSGSGGGGGGGSSQMSIFSGNGQLIYNIAAEPTVPPLVVQLTNTNGTPLVNAPVTFSVASGNYTSLFPTTAYTDSNGRASTTFVQPNQGLNPGTFQLTDVSASSAVGSVDFLETTYQLNADDSGQAIFSIPTPGPGGVISGGEGDVITNGVIAQIFSGVAASGQAPIPNIGIRLGNPSAPLDATQSVPASCQGSALSDQTGTAYCNVVIGCQTGTGNFPFAIVVGEQVYYNAVLTIGPGSTQVIKMVSGSGQSGHSGQTLPQPLVAQVTDNCGKPVAGAVVTWAVAQGSATLTNTKTVADSNGNVSTSVVLGTTAGTIQITVSNSTGSQTFTATNSVSVSSLVLQSGGGQSATINQPFANPLVFAVTDANKNPVPGIVVNFSVSSGTATLSAPSATTTASGIAQVSVTAGGTAGPVVVSASYSTLTATATLTATPPAPVITPSSFTNAASGKVGLVACGLANAVGPGIAPTISGVVPGNPLGFGPLPYTIATTSLTVNGVPAPLYSLSNVNNIQQVTFQTPCESPVGSVAVAITVNGVATTVTNVQVSAAQPGIFTYAGSNSKAYGAVISGVDGSYVTPSNPLRRGQTYYLVATGLGQTTPPATTNAAGAGQSIPTSQLVIGINNAGVPVTSAMYVATGVYYVGFQVPASTPTTTADVPLALLELVGGQSIYDGQGSFLPGGIQ